MEELLKRVNKEIKEILKTNQDIFATEWHELGKTQCKEKHVIRIKEGVKPIKERYYRTTPVEDELIKEEITKMLEAGIIVKSKSSWASPIVIVKKKDGKPRFCIDYRALNRVTVKDAFPLPRIEDILEALDNAKYFSTLDLTSGYWQIKMDPESQAKTAFTTQNEIYEFTVMPFGLTDNH